MFPSREHEKGAALTAEQTARTALIYETVRPSALLNDGVKIHAKLVAADRAERRDPRAKLAHLSDGLDGAGPDTRWMMIAHVQNIGRTWSESLVGERKHFYIEQTKLRLRAGRCHALAD